MTILVHKSDTINGQEFSYAVRTTSDGIDIELISGVTSLEFAEEVIEYIKQLDVCAGYENVSSNYEYLRDVIFNDNLTWFGDQQ